MYYLETSSLRKLIPYLQSRSFRRDKFTSLLALFEILSGIRDQSSFEKRKSILAKILETRLKTDFRLPPEILFEAYGIGPVLSNKKPIIKIMKLIKKCKSYNSFMTAMDKRGLGYAWWFITLYDEHSSISLSNAFNSRKKEIYSNTSSNELSKIVEEGWIEKKDFREQMLKHSAKYYNGLAMQKFSPLMTINFEL